MNKFFFSAILFAPVSSRLLDSSLPVDRHWRVAWHANVLGGVGPGNTVAVW